MMMNCGLRVCVFRIDFHSLNDVNSLSNIVDFLSLVGRVAQVCGEYTGEFGKTKNSSSAPIETLPILHTLFAYHSQFQCQPTRLIGEMPKNFFKDSLCLCYSTPKKRHDSKTEDVYSRPMFRPSPPQKTYSHSSNNGQVSLNRYLYEFVVHFYVVMFAVFLFNCCVFDSTNNGQ